MSIIETFIQKAQPHWDHYIKHPFVQQLAQGSLPRECFQHYLKQDYLYLLHYTRALGLGIYKSNNFTHATTISQNIQVILEETKLHIQYCKSWGISKQELHQVPESPACVAYTRYILDCGLQGSLADLFVAIAPCAVGYARIGQYIQQNYLNLNHNPYQSWIDTYAGEAFQNGVQEMCHFLNELCKDFNQPQLNHLQHVFNTATQMETAFWQMGLDRS